MLDRAVTMPGGPGRLGKNAECVSHFIALWNSRDMAAILAMMTPDCVYHNIPWPAVVGIADIRASLEVFVGSAARIDWRMLNIAETDSGIVLTERLDRFLIQENWIEMPVMGTFELRNGLISHWRDYFDSAQFEKAMASLN